MRVLTFSRLFPKGHISEEQPTHFVEKILPGIHELRDGYAYGNHLPKYHTIRSGNRWKAGDMASLRVWSGKPYNSKQIEFAQVEVKSTQAFEIKQLDLRYKGYFVKESLMGVFDKHDLKLQVIARNDGLTIEDFISWFSIHPKKTGEGFKGQIISWHDNLKY